MIRTHNEVSVRVIFMSDQDPLVCVRNISVEFNVELQAEFIVFGSESEAALLPAIIEVLTTLEVGISAHCLNVCVVLAFL